MSARADAWKTRREKYGARGHAGAYRRPQHPVGRRALDLVVRLHEDGVLSEGQCCKALDIDRVDFRALVDARAGRGDCEGYGTEQPVADRD